MAECSPSQLLASANCLNCLTQNQLRAVQTVLLCQILRANNPMASCDPQTLLDAAGCFECLTSHQLLAVEVQLLCEILHTGGTGGACLMCGEDDPVSPATCDCSLYYNTTTGSFWYWDFTGAGTWVLLIGG